MNIRRGSVQDTDALVAIWRASVRASHDFLSDAEIQDLEPMVREQAIPALEVWVLCTDSSEPIGFMGLHDNNLAALFISPEHFGQGGGRRLLELARRLKGPLLVDVNEQNPRAIGFYLSNGFEVFDRSAIDGAGRPYPLLHLRESQNGAPK